MRGVLTRRRLVVAAAVTCLAVVVVANSWGHTVVDIKPEVYLAPGRAVGQFLDSWIGSPYLGSPNFNVGLTPVVAVLAPGAALGLSPEALFKVFHLALWIVAGVGAARALRSLAPRATPRAGLVAAVAYVANPYAVVGGSTLAILLPYAFLPWLVVALVRALRDPGSWRWPAAFGLAFFAMSGMNVAVVPVFQLLVVPPIAVVVGRAAGRSWPSIVATVAKCASFVLAVSLYWLVPALAASGTGLQVAAESERIEGIAQVSSLVEVLRGMGMWSMYGSGPSGPWLPEFSAYLSNPVLVCITLVWPLLALAALASAPLVLRRVAAVTIGLVAVVMVGFFPGTVTTPLGWVVEQAFEAVPALVAFRTTNKAGAVLALMFALLLGHALPRWFAVLGRSPGRALAAVVAICALGAGWVMPALTGDLYVSRADVPGYWRDAARAVDGQRQDSRVLFLPSQVRASYRWTDERPDDVPNSLMGRGAIIPDTSPNASPPGANFLAALGDLVASGAAGPDTVSTMARYLGAGDVLLRHDTRWEDAAGARPQASASLLAADPGLLGLANFGRTGENVVGPSGAIGFESVLPPVQLYGVEQAVTTVSARPLGDDLTVAGDAWAFDGLARAGRLGTTPVVSYASDTTAEELAGRLGAGHRLVLTDTNRRQEVIANRLVAGYGPLLPEDVAPDATRALGVADAQTVLRRTGPTVTASQVGSAFYDTPYGQVDNAVDADPATSWLFGDFGRAPGTTLDVSWPSARPLGVVSVRPTALGDVHLDRVTLSAGGVSRTVSLPDDGVAEVDLGGVVADRLHLRVDSVRGEGFSLVGIAELDLPGPPAVRVARAPTSFDALYALLDDAGRRAFAGTPFDVSFTRVANGPGAFDDSETALLRDFSLPTARTFTATARVRMLDRSEEALDRLTGRSGEGTATSSSVYFDNPDVRASMASDEDSGTAWIPGGAPVGAWWQIDGPERSLPSIAVEQRRPSAAAPAMTASRVAVEVDGERVTEAATDPGRTVVELPEGTRGRTVRIVVLAVRGASTGLPPQFTTIDAGVSTVSSPTPACRTVALLDGRDLRMRPASSVGVAGTSGAGAAWETCSPIDLGAGAHTLRPAEGYVLDALDLSEGPPPVTQTQGVLNLVASVTGRDVDQRIEVGATDVPVALKIGQSFDPRWRAIVDGVDLGPPRVVDGWSTGWVLEPSGARTVQVRFEPQRAADLALWASAAVLLVAVGLLVFWRRPARRAHHAAGERAPRTVSTRRARLNAGGVGLAATVGFGLPGLVGACVAAAVARLKPGRRDLGIPLGVGLVAVGGLTQVVTSHESWGRVDAAVPAASLWPHWVAVVGLVVCLVSALRPRPAPGSTTEEVRGD